MFSLPCLVQPRKAGLMAWVPCPAGMLSSTGAAGVSEAWGCLLDVHVEPGVAAGEGATAREALRHRSVEKVVMVDIDKVCCCAAGLPIAGWTCLHLDRRRALNEGSACMQASHAYMVQRMFGCGTSPTVCSAPTPAGTATTALAVLRTRPCTKRAPLRGRHGSRRTQVVCDFCERHLDANKAAFADPRLQLIINDARAELEAYPGTFDVIIGDLADPVFGGPCYQVGLPGMHTACIGPYPCMRPAVYR